jgi:hypothetical protein
MRTSKPKITKIRCSICFAPLVENYSVTGNNAQPINGGRCCDGCNKDVVLPARMERFRTAQ